MRLPEPPFLGWLPLVPDLVWMVLRVEWQGGAVGSYWVCVQVSVLMVVGMVMGAGSGFFVEGRGGDVGGYGNKARGSGRAA